MPSMDLDDIAKNSYRRDVEIDTGEHWDALAEYLKNETEAYEENNRHIMASDSEGEIRATRESLEVSLMGYEELVEDAAEILEAEDPDAAVSRKTGGLYDTIRSFF